MEAPYNLQVKKHVDKIFAKMGRKDQYNLEKIYQKLEEVCANPEQFKPLRAPMQNLRRVHVSGSFVIIYSVDREAHAVWVEDFEHHDKIYQ